MSDYSITTSDFEQQKNELKAFAEQTATSTELDKVSTNGTFSDFLSGGLLGLTSHKVTGEEVNKLVTELQACFTEINERDRKVIKEFGQVYETFEALDKGYIQGILVGVKSAEEACKEARSAQEDADDAIKSLQIMVKKLHEFKEQVNSHAHLEDIDDMWGDLSDAKKSIDKLFSEIKNRKETFDKKVSELEKHKDGLLKISHLTDIDELWNLVQKHADIIKELESKQQSLEDSIGDIKVSLDKIEQQDHIVDIDEEWDFSHSLERKFEEKLQASEETNLALKSKIKISYIIAGSAIGISVIQFVLSLLGIL